MTDSGKHKKASAHGKKKRERKKRMRPAVTLSTCYGKAGGTQRFVVHGVQDKVKEY